MSRGATLPDFPLTLIQMPTRKIDENGFATFAAQQVNDGIPSLQKK